MDQNTVMDSTQPSQPHFRLTEAMQLAAITFAGYGCAFSYEAGYLGWFGVPYWFVRLDLIHVLLTISAVWLVLMPMLNYSRLFPSSLLLLLIQWFPPIAAVVLGLVISWYMPHKLSWTLAAAVFMVLVFEGFGLASLYALVVRPIRLHKTSGDWIERWKLGARDYYVALFRFQVGTVGERLATKGEQLVGPALMQSAWSLVALLAGLNLLGTYRAENQVQFTLLRRPVPCFALRRYGEGILCVDVDTAQ
jgi:hypothetical protein